MAYGINNINNNTAFKGYASSITDDSKHSTSSYIRPALQVTATGAGTFGLYKSFMKLFKNPQGWQKKAGILLASLIPAAWLTDKVFRLFSGKKKEFIQEYNPLQEVYKELGSEQSGFKL